jgi:hypothetical protein
MTAVKDTPADEVNVVGLFGVSIRAYSTLTDQFGENAHSAPPPTVHPVCQ